MSNETLADILGDMRNPENDYITNNDLRDLADRIEAAVKRERNRQYEPKCDWSIKDALALANTLANHGLRDGNADAASSCIYSLCRILSAPGNAAAMRAALRIIWDDARKPCKLDREAVARICKEALSAPPPQQSNAAALRAALESVVKYLGDIIPTRREIELIKSARAALGAPARNCDRYLNAARALGAYPDGPPIGDEWDDADWMMFLDWLFAPVGGKREN